MYIVLCRECLKLKRYYISCISTQKLEKYNVNNFINLCSILIKIYYTPHLDTRINIKHLSIN
jgi:hypothetical protein